MHYAIIVASTVQLQDLPAVQIVTRKLIIIEQQPFLPLNVFVIQDIMMTELIYSALFAILPATLVQAPQIQTV